LWCNRYRQLETALHCVGTPRRIWPHPGSLRCVLLPCAAPVRDGACRALALAAAPPPIGVPASLPPLLAAVLPAQMIGTLALKDSLPGCPVSRYNPSRPTSRIYIYIVGHFNFAYFNFPSCFTKCNNCVSTYSSVLGTVHHRISQMNIAASLPSFYPSRRSESVRHTDRQTTASSVYIVRRLRLFSGKRSCEYFTVRGWVVKPIDCLFASLLG